MFSKFKELYKAGDKAEDKAGDKVTLQMEKAMFVVKKSGGEVELTVHVKLTSPAFDSAVSEDERRVELVAKVTK